MEFQKLKLRFSILASVWTKNCFVKCKQINLIRGLGSYEYGCKDLRRRRGGFPDLIVWNKVEKKCKVRVEVDKFSRMLKYFQERICNCIDIWGQEKFVLFEFFSCPPLCIFS